MRGRNIGIWNDVSLAVTGPVTVEEPAGRDDAAAARHLASGRARRGVARRITIRPLVSGVLTRPLRRPDTVRCPVTLDAGVIKTVKLDLQSSQNPKLWWPAGYGDAEPLSGGTVSSMPAAARLGREDLPGGRAAVRLQRRRRRPADLDQRPPLRPPGGNWGFPESMLRYRGARIRRRRALPPRHELHHDPQLGRADRRRRVLRGLRPARHRRLAGLLAGQPVGRPRSRRRRALHAATPTTRSCASATIRRSASTAAATRAIRRRRSTTGTARHRLPSCIPGCTTFRSSADDVVERHGPYQAMTVEFYFKQRATTRSCTANSACPTSSRSTACGR